MNRISNYICIYITRANTCYYDGRGSVWSAFMFSYCAFRRRNLGRGSVWSAFVFSYCAFPKEKSFLNLYSLINIACFPRRNLFKSILSDKYCLFHKEKSFLNLASNKYCLLPKEESFLNLYCLINIACFPRRSLF